MCLGFCRDIRARLRCVRYDGVHYGTVRVCEVLWGLQGCGKDVYVCDPRMSGFIQVIPIILSPSTSLP